MLSNANDLAYLSSEFNSATSVLNSPAKCGMFIDYLFSHKRDPTWTLHHQKAVCMIFALPEMSIEENKR
ncbi:unnamed protein product [Heterobilharzia americana]|nr:unnamed protein product [Heterobilharzia americana]